MTVTERNLIVFQGLMLDYKTEVLAECAQILEAEAKDKIRSGNKLTAVHYRKAAALVRDLDPLNEREALHEQAASQE